MLLSVIIPAYNFEDYIVECVRSVTSQITNFDFEILVRDDHSGDNTNKLLREEFGSDPRVVIFDSSENLGAYDNIKYLLEISQGKYATILDGDDYLNNPHKFQMQIDFLESNPDYIMNSTGYVSLLSDGSLDPPEPGHNRFPKKNEVTTEDLLESNIVSFGRTFRNTPGILKEWMRDFPYLDWGFNYEISLHGRIRCDDWNSGVYRHSKNGMFSLKTEEEKEKNNIRGIEMLKIRENLRKMKTISIVDCFIHDKNVEYNLVNCIKRLKDNEHDVFLISNTPIEKNIIERVDYYLYDNRNQLFEKDYDGTSDVDFWTDCGYFIVHNMKSGIQKHGLSVLINLFNALRISKELGYTHFQRFETDDLYGPLSLDWIDKIPKFIQDQSKKGLFYINRHNSPPDASFHYFNCEIEYFLNEFTNIKSEEDYEKFLLESQGNKKFRIVEEFLYHHIVERESELILKDGGKMSEDFPDTVWNTVCSSSNLPAKYKGCITGIYQVYRGGQKENFLHLYSSNYLDSSKERIIRVEYRETEILSFDINHSLPVKSSWCLNQIPITTESILVFENGELLYTEKIEDVKSHIELR
jgi:glycosyltransferase involved in cell wall biosynthesis